MLKRRTFLQGLCSLPALALLRPAVAQAQPPAPQASLTYTDSEGTPVLSVLHDGNLTTGVAYQA